MAIWELALGYRPRCGRASSPFRVDRNPSGSFYLSKNGFLRFKDFTTGDNFGALDAYELLKKRPYIDIPTEIHEGKEIIPIKPNTKAVPHSKPAAVRPKVHIEVAKGNWTHRRLSYWLEYSIDEDLLREEVTVLKDVDVTKGADEYGLYLDYHSYGYYFPNTKHWKIYQPFSETNKWFGNTTKYDIYGMSTIEGYDDVIITSSGKDYLVLKSMRDEYDLEYDVIAPNGEGYLIPENSRKKIQDCRIHLWYDNDDAGKQCAIRHASTYRANIIHNPDDKPKDPSDWIKDNKDEFIEFLNTKFQ